LYRFSLANGCLLGYSVVNVLQKSSDQSTISIKIGPERLL